MLTIKQYDTRNAIVATLKKNGQPVNLTDCKVLFSMDNGIKTNAQVLETETGKVMYALSSNAVEVPGFYTYEFIVEYPDGRQETFPNDQYLRLQIVKRIGE